jgi:Tfp pilus assembly protein PilF
MKKSIIALLLLVFLLPSCASKKNSALSQRKIKPGSPLFLMNEGILHLNAGQLNAAEKKLLMALKKVPNLMGAICSLGIVYLNKGHLKTAEKQFKKAIQLNPKYADGHNYLGIIYSEWGEYDLAKENFVMAANAVDYKTPENAFANLALMEIKHFKLDSAMRYVDNGLAKNKKFPTLYNIKGIILENGKNYSEAIKYYKKALELAKDKDNVHFLINLGRVYSILGYNVRALNALEKAMPKAYSEPLKNQIREMIRRINEK